VRLKASYDHDEEFQMSFSENFSRARASSARKQSVKYQFACLCGSAALHQAGGSSHGWEVLLNCSGDTPRCKGYVEDRSEICEKRGYQKRRTRHDARFHRTSIVESILRTGDPSCFDETAVPCPLYKSDLAISLLGKSVSGG
jgi:hypothetical protein